jgi:hypothetical protein
MKLEAVISLVESSGQPHAIRFEPELYESDPQWIENQEAKIIAANHHCSKDTARQIAVTSYGLYQLLGANVWNLGYTGDMGDFLNDVPGQMTIFNKFIEPKGFVCVEDISSWAPSRWTSFAAFYNGPGAVEAYVAAMRKAAGLSG